MSKKSGIPYSFYWIFIGVLFGQNRTLWVCR